MGSMLAIRSVSVAVEQEAEERSDKNLDVKPDGPIFNIPEIILGALVNGGVAAQAIDLGPAGEAGLFVVAVHVARHQAAKLLDEGGLLRAGAHQAHIAQQNVYEVGELVDGIAAQDGADAGAARIVFDGPARP